MEYQSTSGELGIARTRIGEDLFFAAWWRANIDFPVVGALGTEHKFAQRGSERFCVWVGLVGRLLVFQRIRSYLVR